MEKSFASRLDRIDVLYVYGIGLGEEKEIVLEWLKKDRAHLLVFLEDDIDPIQDLFTKTSLFEDPQVHLRLILDADEWDLILEECSRTFASERIEVRTLDPNRKRRNRRREEIIRLFLLQKSGLFYALISESLHIHYLFRNFSYNFRRISESFYANQLENKFPKIPAVICGAGPSLASCIESLKKLENKALILAGGSAITALSHFGIVPHLGMVLDPNDDEYLRLKPLSSFAFPLLYINRVLPDVFCTCNGPFGYVRSDRATPCETWMENELGITGNKLGSDLEKEALSVTTLLLSFAYSLGCDPIILTGVDLGYTDHKRYVEGVMAQTAIHFEKLESETRATDQLIYSKDRFGKQLLTQVKWMMEKEVISAFAKSHPDRSVINATERGLLIPGLREEHLQDLLKEDFISYDLRGMIHTEIQNHPLLIAKEKIAEHLNELKKSLERCGQIAQEMLQEVQRIPKLSSETGKMVLLEMDFEEELAYKTLLENVGPAFELIKARGYFDPIEKQEAKWKFLAERIDAILGFLIS